MEIKDMNTKDKILYTSLRLFSKKGYDGVSMREIAAEVGIKGASIYAHFKGKQDIFDAIFEKMKTSYDAFAPTLGAPVDGNMQEAQMLSGAGEETLFAMAEGLFSLYAKDEFMVMTRQLLQSEQYRNEVAAKYLKEYYFDMPIQFQTMIFEGMKASGLFTGKDAGVMALQFYSPIYVTLCAYDLGKDYDECIEQLQEHIHSWKY